MSYQIKDDVYSIEGVVVGDVRPIHYFEHENGIDRLTELRGNELLIKTLKRIEDGAARYLAPEQREPYSISTHFYKPYLHLVDCKVLWSLYCCYKVLTWNAPLSKTDKDVLSEVVLAEAKDYAEGYGFDQVKTNEFITAWKSIHKQRDLTQMCWEALDVMTLNIIDSSAKEPLCWQSLYVDTDLHKIETRLICSDAYHAMCYQLLLRIQNGEDGLEGRARVICPGCGKEFIRRSRKVRLCDECAKPENRLKRHRANKKEAAKDGQH